MPVPRHVRYRCHLSARIAIANGIVKAHVLEMSESGAFIEETFGFNDFQVGDRGTLTLALPGGAPWATTFEIARLGTTRREIKNPTVEDVTVSARGFGVEFINLLDEDLERLRDFLELFEQR
jgi:hypothetical protein